MKIDNEFINNYNALVRSTIRDMNIKDEETLELLYSDVWIKLLERQDTYDESRGSESTFIVWVTRSVVSHYMEKLKASEDVMNTGLAVSLDAKASDEPGASTWAEHIPDAAQEERTNTKQIVESLYFYTASMKPNMRDVLRLKLVEGYSHQEIADRLGIERRSSETLYLRGVKKIKGLLRSDGRGEFDKNAGKTYQDMYNTLPPQLMYPLKFRLEGKTWEEISDLTGEPLSVLQTRVNKAKDELHDRFGATL